MATTLPDDSRVSVDSDTSYADYNRIHLDSSFRDKILAQFEDDSVESLVVPAGYADDEDDEHSGTASPIPPPQSQSSKSPAAQHNLPQLSTSPPHHAKAKGPSRLSEVVQSSDIPTPKASQLNDPFAQAKAESNKSPNTPTGSNADLTPTVTGSNLSKVSTGEDSEGKSPNKSRPGTLRRLTTKMKRTMSSKG
jgi:hypothetical protein